MVKEKEGIIKDGRYTPDVRPEKLDLEAGPEDGFFVTIRKDHPHDPFLTEVVGHYFINSTGTLFLEYDVLSDQYKLLAGINEDLGKM